MNNSELNALGEFLQNGITLNTNAVPAELTSTEYIKRKDPAVSVCPDENCQARVKLELDATDGKRRFICHAGCDTTRPTKEFTQYSLYPDTILPALCKHLDLTATGEPEEEFPKYVVTQTEENIEVCLIGSPYRYQSTIEELIKRALEQQRVLVILTPSESIQDIINVAKHYPLGSLVCPLPLSVLADGNRIRELITNIGAARERAKTALENHGLEFTGTIDQLGQNPALVETALTYLQVLREEQGTSSHLGEEFEEVCKGAIASLHVATNLGFGGTANRGEKLPDIVFGLDADPTRSQEYSKALGLVDAKSGTTARFSSEKIAGKHTEYLKHARRSETYRDWHICHIFIVFAIDGYKEIDWYDEIKDAYDGYDDNVTMVVLYADALRQLVSAHRNFIEASELKLAEGHLSRVLRPLFDHNVHTADWVPADIDSMVRVSSDDPTKREQEYIKQYYQRSNLIVVTAEMVDAHLRGLQQKDDEYKRLLEAYTN